MVIQQKHKENYRKLWVIYRMIQWSRLWLKRPTEFSFPFCEPYLSGSLIDSRAFSVGLIVSLLFDQPISGLHWIYFAWLDSWFSCSFCEFWPVFIQGPSPLNLGWTLLFAQPFTNFDFCLQFNSFSGTAGTDNRFWFTFCWHCGGRQPTYHVLL